MHRIDAEQICCEGCKGEGDALFFYCRDCRIRTCASAHGHNTCAACADYETCDALAQFYAEAPEPKGVLDAIREGRPHLGIRTFKETTPHGY